MHLPSLALDLLLRFVADSEGFVEIFFADEFLPRQFTISNVDSFELVEGNLISSRSCYLSMAYPTFAVALVKVFVTSQ